MIDRSSNLATDNVIELVGAQRVMSITSRIGADDVHVLRGVEDQKAFDHAMNNTVSAYGLMMVYRAILASPDAKPMLDVLSAQEFNSGIPAGLPPGTRVAHKTGNIKNYAHDSGVVYRPDGSAYSRRAHPRLLEDVGGEQGHCGDLARTVAGVRR